MRFKHHKENLGQLDIVVPGLFSSLVHWKRETGDVGTYPALASYLSHSQETESLCTSNEARLYSLFFDTENDVLPVAEIRVLADNLALPHGARVLCADPCSITAGMNDVTIAAACLQRHEVKPFANIINEHLKEQQLVFTLRSGQTGLCWGFKDLNINTQPLSAAQQTGLHVNLPTGGSAGVLQTLSTEIQMLLHSAPFNQQRAAEGWPLINGVWFWGEGTLPDAATPYRQLVGSKLLADVAHGTGANYIGNHPPYWFESLWKADEIVALVELTGLGSSDFDVWRTKMEKYEEEFFAPLLQLLKKNPKLPVRLFDDQQSCFTWQPKKLLSFFKKTKTLENLVEAARAAHD